MCGITGIVGLEDKTLIKKMTSALKHRGPDDEGFYVEDGISFGHRRLSIIDTSKKGHQPMLDAESELILVFNGEIYNYKELRRTLEKKYSFSSETDSEVILYAYKEYGVQCLKKFNGMFAFAIYDKRKKHLFLARDRVGIKPVYYTQTNEAFLFASEMKAILEMPDVPKEIHPDGLYQYLNNAYIPAPLTIFKGINKLKAGHYLLYDFSSKKAKIQQYWDCADIQETDMSEETALKTFEKHLSESVQFRLRSDVPLGAFLSGGIDSTLIVSKFAELLKKEKTSTPMKTFCIGFSDSEYDESRHARIIADHFSTDHHEFFLSPKDISVVPKLIRQFDEPFADPSMLPMYFVSQLARKYVTVTLSGDGGDELFGGYQNYQTSKYELLARKITSKPLLKKSIQYTSKMIQHYPRNKYSLAAKKIAHLTTLDEEHQAMSKNIKMSDAEKVALFPSIDRKKQFSLYQQYYSKIKGSLLAKQSYSDIKTYMPEDILMKVDKTTMLNSLESRVPLLDHNLVEFSRSVPSSLKLKGKTTKYLLRKYLHSKAPSSILERKKKGFSVPIGSWFKSQLSDDIHNSLLDVDFINTFSLEKKMLKRLLNHNKKQDYGKTLWQLYVLQKWSETYLG